MFFCHNKYYCFRPNFRTILHWHRHAFSWLFAPASNEGKILTFLHSTCERSRYRHLHVVGRLLVVITSFCPSCEATVTGAKILKWLATRVTGSRQRINNYSQIINYKKHLLTLPVSVHETKHNNELLEINSLCVFFSKHSEYFRAQSIKQKHKSFPSSQSMHFSFLPAVRTHFLGPIRATVPLLLIRKNDPHHRLCFHSPQSKGKIELGSA